MLKLPFQSCTWERRSGFGAAPFHPPAFNACSCSFPIPFLAGEGLEPPLLLFPGIRDGDSFIPAPSEVWVFYPIVNASRGWRSSTSRAALPAAGYPLGRKSFGGNPKPRIVARLPRALRSGKGLGLGQAPSGSSGMGR